MNTSDLFILPFFIQYNSWEWSNSEQCDEVQAAWGGRGGSQREGRAEVSGGEETWIERASLLTRGVRLLLYAGYRSLSAPLPSLSLPLLLSLNGGAFISHNSLRVLLKLMACYLVFDFKYLFKDRLKNNVNYIYLECLYQHVWQSIEYLMRTFHIKPKLSTS